jgi:hypothetical protein
LIATPNRKDANNNEADCNKEPAIEGEKMVYVKLIKSQNCARWRE